MLRYNSLHAVLKFRFFGGLLESMKTIQLFPHANTIDQVCVHGLWCEQHLLHVVCSSCLQLLQSTMVLCIMNAQT